MLAVLVLFSTFSFTVERHLCGGEVADFSIIGNLETCKMPESNDTFEKSSLYKTPCCQDTVETIESSNNELNIVKELELQRAQFAFVFIYSYLYLFDDLEENTTAFRYYRPPLVVKDIPVLYNTFLI